IAFTQFVLNRPPYSSLEDYRATRATELQALGPPVQGPVAQVGWMEARWYLWTTSGGERAELVKFDRSERPIVESRGVEANGYAGPGAADILPDGLAPLPSASSIHAIIAGYRPMPLEIRDPASCRWDLVSLGEVMLRLDPGEGRIATTRSFQCWE